MTALKMTEFRIWCVIARIGVACTTESSRRLKRLIITMASHINLTYMWKVLRIS